MKHYFIEMRRIFVFALPLMGTQVLGMSLAFVDTMMAGMISPTALAAAGVASMLFDSCFMIIVGLFALQGPKIATAMSGEDRLEVRSVFQQGLWLSLFSGIVMFFFTQNIYRIMPLIGVEPEIIPLAKDYLDVTAWMILFSGVSMSFRSLNEGLSNLKILFIVSVMSIPLNAAGNYIFINGLFGLPKLGVHGIALSSLIMWMSLIVFFIVYAVKKSEFKALRLFKKVALPNWKVLHSMVSNGFPVSLSLVMEVGMFSIVGLLMATLSTKEAAANQIALNFTAMIFMIPLGLSMALSICVGQAVGEKNIEKVKHIGISGLFLSLTIMCVTFLTLFFFRDTVSSFYSDDSEVISIASGLLLIAALFQLPDGIQVAISGCLRGLQDTKKPMLYAFLGYWVIGVPIGYLLGIVMNMRGQGLWIGLICGLSVTALLGVKRFFLLTKQPR